MTTNPSSGSLPYVNIHDGFFPDAALANFDIPIRLIQSSGPPSRIAVPSLTESTSQTAIAREVSFEPSLSLHIIRSPRRRGPAACLEFWRPSALTVLKAPPSATNNARRPRVTVIRPSRARCVKVTIRRHERAVLTARHPARAGRTPGCNGARPGLMTGADLPVSARPARRDMHPKLRSSRSFPTNDFCKKAPVVDTDFLCKEIVQQLVHPQNRRPVLLRFEGQVAHFFRIVL